MFLMAKVVVPNLIGMELPPAEKLLDSLRLLYIIKNAAGKIGETAATEQTPKAGTSVGELSVVTVTFPNPLGPLPDPPVEGIVEGEVEGTIVSLGIGRRGGVGIEVIIDDTNKVPVPLTLVEDPPDDGLLPPQEWMRRGSVLGLAQRAFTNADRIHLTVDKNTIGRIAIKK
jgi:hypothetical protein